MNYNQAEIAEIFTACTTKKEVMKICESFRYLMLLNSRENLQEFTKPALNRIKALNINKK